MKRLRWIALFPILGLLSGCPFGSAKEETFSGTLELTEHSMGARASGRLTQLFVDEGDAVHKEQLLATLDRYEKTERDFHRIQELYRHGGATKQALEEAALTYEDQRVISPVDGVVLVKVREVGEVLTPGASIVVLGDRQELWVRIFVSEDRVSRLHLNQAATIRVDGLPTRFKGHVSYIAPSAEFTPRNVQSPEERVTQTFGVKIMLDERPDNLRPGVAADVTLSLKG